MQTDSQVTTIIPTLATIEKAANLKRAVDSIRHSSNIQVSIVVVVNGARADPELCEWLSSQPDIQYERVARPSLPLAVCHGREIVQTPFFSFLDDDDEYLPCGIDIKLVALKANPLADIVITSGFRQSDDGETMANSPIAHVPLAPLASLFETGWLSSCNALYRSSAFPASFFIDAHPFAEWTWLAFKLAMAKRQIVALSEPTFRIHDTPGSLSKSDSYHAAYQSLYNRMLGLSPPLEIAKIIRTRMSADWHNQSVRALSNERLFRAIACHLHSLLLPGGRQYLTYTRRLLPGWPISW